MHFISLLLLSSLLRIHLSSSHYVMFEEISQMAGALSYIHAIVPVNISRLVQAVHIFHCNILSIQKVYYD
jgi:hypothetical protein